MPPTFTDPDALADAVIAQLGKRIVMAMPLGLGKAVHVVNALYAKAAADPSITLHIFTALSLEKPRYGSDLERRFLEPVIERLFGGYPSLAYVEPLRKSALPANIKVEEFFFQAGASLNRPQSQQSYIAANYTHALRYILAMKPNLIGQLVAKRESGGETRYSLSGNTDITLDLLKARREDRADFLVAGQVNGELPFMPGAGDVPADTFEFLLDGPDTEFPLFAPPNEPVGDARYAQGLNAAALVSDGGTLQLGIGSVSDAVVKALLIRQEEPQAFKDLLGRLSPQPTIPHETDAFKTGLYASTEMVVDGFLHLYRAGILKREVDGAVLHGGFFLGPKGFYKALREMPAEDLARLQMVAVSFTNQLYGDEDKKRAARCGGRFINTAMMATLMGAVISDGLEDGRVVSGVGGQFNFVEQAFALTDARSIITLNATRTAGGKCRSNILWSYGHGTIPRHMKDVIVTEYGAADLRGRNDRDTIAAMLTIADSRFQPDLLKAAKAAKKIEASYEIPAAYRDNTPEQIARALKPAREAGLLPAFPLGTDFDETEQRLLPALGKLQAAQPHPRQMIGLLAKGLRVKPSAKDEAALKRMGLDAQKSLKDGLYAALLKGALA
jgi:acyl-CoA hydrolase